MRVNCNVCSVQLFLGTDHVLATTCGHIFHRKCLLTWLYRSKTCPKCRTNCILGRNTIKIYCQTQMALYKKLLVENNKLKQKLANNEKKLQSHFQSAELYVKYLENKLGTVQKEAIELAGRITDLQEQIVSRDKDAHSDRENTKRMIIALQNKLNAAKEVLAES